MFSMPHQNKPHQNGFTEQTSNHIIRYQNPNNRQQQFVNMSPNNIEHATVMIQPEPQNQQNMIQQIADQQNQSNQPHIIMQQQNFPNETQFCPQNIVSTTTNMPSQELILNQEEHRRLMDQEMLRIPPIFQRVDDRHKIRNFNQQVFGNFTDNRIMARKTPPWQQNKMIQNYENPTPPDPPQFDRVPPLHQHTPTTPVWNEEQNRKRTKQPKIRNKRYVDPRCSDKPCPNVDVRQIDQNRPTFMEDPSGYLAQQTALLNSTIQRQTGLNNGYVCNSPDGSKAIPTSKPVQFYNRCNSSKSSPYPVQFNKPDMSSVSSSTSVTQVTQCQGCVSTSQISSNTSYSNKFYQIQQGSMSVENNSRENSPVTSSISSDRFSNLQQSPDSRPIQGM